MSTATRLCRYCKSRGPVEDMVNVNGGWFHSVDAAAKYGREGAKKRESRERNRQKREKLSEDFPHQLELTRVAFNEFIRVLDEGKPCISCGKSVCGSEFHAGHFKPVSSHPEIRFNPLNVFLQGSGCNMGEKYSSKRRREVQEGYEANLRAIFGQELVDWLNGPHEPANYTCYDLKIMRAMYRAEIKYIREHGKPSREWRQFPPRGSNESGRD